MGANIPYYVRIKVLTEKVVQVSAVTSDEAAEEARREHGAVVVLQVSDYPLEDWQHE